MEMCGQVHAPATLPPGKQPPVPIVQEAEWAPEPLWTRWGGEKTPALATNRTPVVQPVDVAKLTKTQYETLKMNMKKCPNGERYKSNNDELTAHNSGLLH
jgi:hypothetical protein